MSTMFSGDLNVVRDKAQTLHKISASKMFNALKF